MAKACDNWKRGDRLKGLVKSALRPVNICFVRKTSVSTSFLILSTVPGFESPSASRRWVKVLYVSRSALRRPLSRKVEGRGSSKFILAI